MTRVEVVFLRSELDEMLPFLQEQGVVHLQDVPLAVEDFPGFLHRVHLPEDKKAELERLQQLATQLKEITPLLTTQASGTEITAAGPEVASWSSDVQRQRAGEWHDTLSELGRQKVVLQDNIERIQNYGKILEVLSPVLAANSVSLGQNGRAVVLEGYSAEALENLEKKLVSTVGPECGLITQPFGRSKKIVVISHPEEKATAVADFIDAEGILPADVPDDKLHGTSVSELVHKVGSRVGALQADLDEVLSRIQVFSEEHGPGIAALNRITVDGIAQIEVTNKFAQSSMVVVMHGWVPTDAYGELGQNLRKDFGDRVAVDVLPMDDIDLHHVPTLRKNHPIFQPFELVMSLMRPPTYGTFDPTWLVAVSFILFYGFILGDAGYGAIIIAIGAWVKSKWGHIKPLRDGMSIFQYMGASSIVFGLIYFEIFGNLMEDLVGFPPFCFHRAHETDMLLYLGIAFGAIHIPLSLVLGIKEGYAHGHAKHAEEKLGMLLGLFALAIAVSAGAGFFPVSAQLGYFLAVLLVLVATYYLLKSMGAMAPMGAVEVIGLTANVLSYSRLMALGIASIAFADIANDLPEMLGGGPVGYLLGIPMALGVHLLNIGIGVFSPTIHSLRLNFVEFLPKFYEPQGKDYEPFRKELVW